MLLGLGLREEWYVLSRCSQILRRELTTLMTAVNCHGPKSLPNGLASNHHPLRFVLSQTLGLRIGSICITDAGVSMPIKSTVRRVRRSNGRRIHPRFPSPSVHSRHTSGQLCGQRNGRPPLPCLRTYTIPFSNIPQPETVWNT